MKKIILISLLMTFVLGGCASNTTKQSDTTGLSTEQKTFQPGIYYSEPNPSQFLGSIHLFGSDDINIINHSVGFALLDKILAQVNDQRIIFIDPDGTQRKLEITGLYGLARPTISPDGRYVAAQASIRNFPPQQGPGPTDLGIFVIDTKDGTFTQINDVDPTGQSESPEWFHRSNKIAYSSFSREKGVHLHVYDFDAKKEVLFVPDAGGLHIAVSKDDNFLLNSGDMKIYNAQTGKETGDLQQAAIDGLHQTEYEINTEHNGMNTRDGFTLDGDWSPDGKSIVFDGNVKLNDRSGMVLMSMNIDGTGLRILRAPFPVNPDFSNNNNFSQLNPLWLE